MDKEEDDESPAQEWSSSLNATCNRLSTQYLSLLRSASGGPSAFPTSTSTSSSMISGGTSITPSSGALSVNAVDGPTSGATGGTDSFIDEQDTRKQLERSGGGLMREQNEPPAPLAADAALARLQAKLATENIYVAVCNLLDLIRTLRLSALLMEEDVIAAEEEEEFLEVKRSAKEAAIASTVIEEDLMNIRNFELKDSICHPE